jgi:glycosyltransferase involved in cell wall biosynthesis
VADMIAPDMGAICSPENDPDVLAGVLRQYLDDADLRARHGAAARSYAEAVYAAPVVAEQIERLLEAAIAQKR